MLGREAEILTQAPTTQCQTRPGHPLAPPWPQQPRHAALPSYSAPCALALPSLGTPLAGDRVPVRCRHAMGTRTMRRARRHT